MVRILVVDVKVTVFREQWSFFALVEAKGKSSTVTQSTAWRGCKNPHGRGSERTVISAPNLKSHLLRSGGRGGTRGGGPHGAGDILISNRQCSGRRRPGVPPPPPIAYACRGRWRRRQPRGTGGRGGRVSRGLLNPRFQEPGVIP
jgi:hypothetical protein